MLSAVPLLYRLLGVVAIVAALGGGLRLAYDHIRKEAYDAGYSDMRAVCEREKAEQRKANQDAIDAANKRLLQAADQLSSKEQELEDALAQSDREAEADPDRKPLCVTPGGMRRIDAIR